MAFKLKFQGKGKNPYGTMVNRGLITPALRPGPGDEKKGTKGNQSDADNQATEQAKSNMKVVSTETRKVDGGTEIIENLEGKGKGKTYAEAGVDPAKAKAYWDANPEKYKEYLASKKLKDQRTTFIPDDKPKETPPDYSYLDGATFGSGYKSGDFTTYGLKLMSTVGDDDPRPKSQQREGEDPMSRYLTQAELDYLKSKGRLKGEYSSGYDDYYKQFSPESKTFQKGVERGLIDSLGNTIQLEQPTEEDNLFKESGLANE